MNEKKEKISDHPEEEGKTLFKSVCIVGKKAFIYLIVNLSYYVCNKFGRQALGYRQISSTQFPICFFPVKKLKVN